MIKVDTNWFSNQQENFIRAYNDNYYYSVVISYKPAVTKLVHWLVERDIPYNCITCGVGVYKLEIGVK